MLSLRSALATTMAAAFLFALGCGPSTIPASGDTYEVTGTVSTGSGPLKVGVIHFKPEGPGRDELCVITDGKFALKMFAGKYKVAFDLDEPRSTLPGKYRAFATSGQSAEVKSSGNDFKFELK